MRHADAGDRAGFTGDDRLRPLSALGVAQAKAIAARLGSRPIGRVISSPYLRCVGTVEPVAQRFALEVEPARYLAEGHDPELVAEALLEDLEATRSGTELVACSHGDVIPYVVEHFLALGAHGSGGRSSPKAVTFTCRVLDKVVVAIERTAPPKP